jgi:hypothetical protein
MPVAGAKLILALVCLLLSLVCLLLSFVLYSFYVMATVVVAGITGIGQFVGIAITYLLVAALFLCVSICFMLNSPLDLVRILLQ